MTSMRSDLQRIAHRAMLDRGLVPEFSAAEMTEARGLDSGVGPADPAIRDLRGLLWASIDNDDSRDLDQLTVAEAISPNATRILIAIADVDAKVKQGSAVDRHARINTTSVYTDARIFPMLPELLSTDLTSLNEGQERLALVVDMIVDGEGQVTEGGLTRAVVVNRAKLAYNAVAAWLEGKSEPPAKVAAVAGLAENLLLQDRVAQVLRKRRHENGALELETLEPRAVFQGDAVSDLRLERQNRAKQADRGLHGGCERRDRAVPGEEGIPVGAAGAALARALGTDRRAGGDPRHAAARRARRACAGGLPGRAPRGRPRALSGPVALGGEVAWPRRVRPRDAGPARDRALRVGGAGLHPLDRAEPTVPRPPHAAPGQGGARRPAAALSAGRPRRAGATLHRRRGRRGQGRTAGEKVGRGPAPAGRGSARRSRAS